jgi:hypothetical protein
MRSKSFVLPFIFAISACAQEQAPVSDPLAISLAQRSVLALTGGAAVTDVTLTADVISVFGSDNKSGTGVFQAKGAGESRVDLSLEAGTRSDVRNTAGGAWSRDGGSATAYAGHNSLTDAVWFFPALSCLTQTANPNFTFKYMGQEQHGLVNTQHIRVFHIASQDPAGLVQRLSAMDFYLDSGSLLPLAVAFKRHPEDDLNVDIAIETRFASYQLVSGVQVPFYFQQILNGSVVLDVKVRNADLNVGLLDSLFTLQ